MGQPPLQEERGLSAARGARLKGCLALVPVTLGLVLLVAGLLKSYQLVTEPTAASGILGLRWLTVGGVELELLLGLWLLTGVCPRHARGAALLCFAGFLAVSLSRARSGEVSCGCFGKVPVSPWVTAGLDLVAVAALWAWRPADGAVKAPRSAPGTFALAGATALLLVVVGALGVARPAPASVDEDGDIIGDGPVMLEPEKWVGKRFPLLRHIDIGPQLASGHWVVVLYRRHCPRCQEELLKYERLARESAWLAGGLQVAFVAVPQAGEAGERTDAGPSPCLRGSLSSAREWFVKVPAALHVEGGRVTAVGNGEGGG